MAEQPNAVLQPDLPSQLRTLLNWVEQVSGASIAATRQVSGGNRCQSWSIDVTAPSGDKRTLFLRFQPFALTPAEIYSTRREAEIYKAISGSAVPAPRFIAAHPTIQAMLMEEVEGSATYRRLKDPATKTAIAREVVEGIAQLHALDPRTLELPTLGPVTTIADHVRQELDTWHAMHEESRRRDPIVEFGFRWLYEHLPNPDERPALVHGDAGPGNFMFAHGKLQALIDWGLGHLGDPMEDLAWFSMRSVMEPVPDFPDLIASYEAASGRKVDVARILYHRVVVSQRVLIIRNRNVSGAAGSSIVSRALNRRLLIEAIADAGGLPRPALPIIEAPCSASSGLYDALLDQLRDVIVPRSTDSVVIGAAKEASKVLKYLREMDRIGGIARAQQIEALSRLLGADPKSVEAGEAELAERIRAGTIQDDDAFAYFGGQVARDIDLARGVMGGIATRSFPPLESRN